MTLNDPMYCTDFLSKDWKKTMREINFRILFKFMEWCIHQTVDKNGNKKREVGSKGSLVMWCNFRMLYLLEVGHTINNRISSLKVSNVSRSETPTTILEV